MSAAMDAVKAKLGADAASFELAHVPDGTAVIATAQGAMATDHAAVDEVAARFRRARVDELHGFFWIRVEVALVALAFAAMAACAAPPAAPDSTPMPDAATDAAPVRCDICDLSDPRYHVVCWSDPTTCVGPFGPCACVGPDRWAPCGQCGGGS